MFIELFTLYTAVYGIRLFMIIRHGEATWALYVYYEQKWGVLHHYTWMTSRLQVMEVNTLYEMFV